MAEHRRRYRLVGLGHELEYWEKGHEECPPLGDQWERDYDPAELDEGEAWVAKVFEPVREVRNQGKNLLVLQQAESCVFHLDCPMTKFIFGLTHIASGFTWRCPNVRHFT